MDGPAFRADASAGFRLGMPMRMQRRAEAQQNYHSQATKLSGAAMSFMIGYERERTRPGFHAARYAGIEAAGR